MFTGKIHSEDTKRRIGESVAEKVMGENNGAFGTHWYTNGKINVRAKECPEGFWKGRCRVGGVGNNQFTL